MLIRNASEPISRATEGRVAGERVLFDVSGALFLPDADTLVVSDLHLEKGSAFARRGQMLPPYDTVTTLRRLSVLLDLYRPRFVVSLGDSFHDGWGAERLPESLKADLEAMMAGRVWYWVAGNHDPDAPRGLPGETVDAVAIGALLLRHEPTRAAPVGEVAGHLHPGARVVVRGRSLRRACFASDGSRLIMPAFGAYTGMLNVLDRAYAGLFDWSAFRAFMLGSDRVYGIARDALRAG